MSGLTVRVAHQDITTVETDALVVGFFEDIRPLKDLAGRLDWLLCGALSRLLIEKRIQGRLGDVALLTPRGKVPAGKIFLIGCGPRSVFSLAALQSVAKSAATCVAGAGVSRAAVEYMHAEGIIGADGLASIRAGLIEGIQGRDLTVTLLVQDNDLYGRLVRGSAAPRESLGF